MIRLEAHHRCPDTGSAALCAGGSARWFGAWLGWYRFGFTRSRGAQGER